MKGSISLLAVLVLGCAPKKPDPVRTLPENATTTVPGMPSGAHARVSCRGLSREPCQTLDFTLDATYSTPDTCRVNMNNQNEVSFKMNTGSAEHREQVFVSMRNFRGAGTYNLDSDTEYVSLTDYIVHPAGQCGASAGDAEIRSHKHSCGGCQVVVTDADPNAPYPKPLTFSISCSSLCAEDTHKCGGINMQLTQTCTQ